MKSQQGGFHKHQELTPLKIQDPAVPPTLQLVLQIRIQRLSAFNWCCLIPSYSLKHRGVLIVYFWPPHLRLRSIRPPSCTVDNLMFYSSYHFELALNTRTSSDTTETRLNIKNMTITLKNHMFSGADQIRVCIFLSFILNESGTLNMREAQAFIGLPHFLEDPAESQFKTKLSGGSRYARIAC